MSKREKEKERGREEGKGKKEGIRNIMKVYIETYHYTNLAKRVRNWEQTRDRWAMILMNTITQDSCSESNGLCIAQLGKAQDIPNIYCWLFKELKFPNVKNVQIHEHAFLRQILLRKNSSCSFSKTVKGHLKLKAELASPYV